MGEEQIPKEVPPPCRYGPNSPAAPGEPTIEIRPPSSLDRIRKCTPRNPSFGASCWRLRSRTLRSARVGAQRSWAGVGEWSNLCRRGGKFGLRFQALAGGTPVGLVCGHRNLLGTGRGAAPGASGRFPTLPAWAQSAWRENEASQTWLEKVSPTVFIYPFLSSFRDVTACPLCPEEFLEKILALEQQGGLDPPHGEAA